MLKLPLLLSNLVVLMMVLELDAAADVYKWKLPALFIFFAANKKTNIKLKKKI